MWALAAFSTATALAERSTFATYGSEQGLPSLGGHCLTEDGAGDILVGTEHGVVAFDGRRFVELGPGHGLRQGGTVFAIVATASGRIVVQYANGVYVSTGASDPSHPATSLSFRVVDHPGISFYANHPHRLVSWQGDAVLLAEDRIVRIVTTAGQGTRIESLGYTPAERMSLDGASAIFSVDGHLWETFEDDRICAADPGAVRCYGTSDGLTTGPWFDIVMGSHGTILARSAASVATLNPSSGRWSVVGLPDQGLQYETYSASLGLFSAPDGAVVTQAAQGLAVLGPAGWYELTVLAGAPYGTIADAMTDRTGQLWFLILGRGLVRWAGYGNWETIEKSDGLSDGFPWQTARSKDGSLWVTTDGGVDQIVRAGTSQRVSQIFEGASYALETTSDGNVWYGFRQGVRIRDPATGLETVVAMPYAESIVAGGSHAVWIGTKRGLYRLEDTGPTAFHPTLLVPSRTLVRSIVRDGNAGVYYLSSGHLHHWHFNGADVALTDPGLPDALDADSMAIAPDGSLWIGGSGGLSHVTLSDDRIQSYRLLPSDLTQNGSIYALMIDHRGWLWVGTSQGVSVYDGSRWASAQAGQGLLSDDLSENGIREDPDGSIWIVTAHGISHLRDPALLFVERPFEVVVTGAFVGTRSIHAGGVAYTQDPISFEFGTPNHGLERPVLFLHALSGVDTSWVASPLATVTYPFVPPGRHVLTVVARDQLLHRDSPPTSFVIKIAYPWWRRWWAELLWAAVVACVLYAGARIRYRALYARQLELERHVARATEELRYQATHDKLTGLLTRSETETRLATRLDRGHPGDEFVIALLDVDHFKRINDNFGHLGGDEILRALGRSIARTLREEEYAGRYGGEELLLVLNDTDGRAAERVLNLHLAIRHDTFRIGDEAIRVTCSVGIAWAMPGDSWETLIGRADVALYEAKDAGRDQVVESRAQDARMSDAQLS